MSGAGASSASASASASAAEAEAASPDNDVVYECDLVLSQPPAGEALYLLQYPLRQAAAPVGSTRAVTSARIRPRHGRLELSVAVLPTVDGRPCGTSFDYERQGHAARNLGDAQTLRSPPAATAATRPHANYAAAALTPRALVLAPLRAVAQLRPAFDYLNLHDVSTATSRSAAAAVDDEDDKEPTPLALNFRKRESEQAAARRRKSFAALMRREGDDPWKPLSFLAAERAASSGARCKLFDGAAARARVKSEDVPQAVAAPPALKPVRSAAGAENYIALFNAHTRTVVAKRPAHEPQSQNAMLAANPLDAVTALVRQARIVSFADCLRVTCASVPPDEVVKALTQVAMLVEGNWVARDVSCPPTSRKLAERLDAARVIIVAMFRDGNYVFKERAMEAVKGHFADERVGAIIAEIGVKCKDPVKGRYPWKLKLPADRLFLQYFSHVVPEQGEEWERRLKVAHAALGERKRHKSRKSKAQAGTAGEPSSGKAEKRRKETKEAKESKQSQA